MNLLSKISISTLFFIPIIPHLNIIENVLHTDDLPIIIFVCLAIYEILRKKKIIFDDNIKYLIIFITYITIQNYVINKTFLSSDSLRFSFYLLLFVYVVNFKIYINFQSQISYLLSFLTLFSITAYFFEFDFGSDIYQTWNIGFNESNLEYLKGRINGFQAGGPNSFADLITILTIYIIFKVDDKKAILIASTSFLAILFTYSRFSIIVLFLFVLYRIYMSKYKKFIIYFVILLLIVSHSFGLIDRFLNDDNSGISDRMLMVTASIEYFSDLDLLDKIFGVGSNQLIFLSDEVFNFSEFNKNPYSYGPHNSYIFYLINYGILGFSILILFIFKFIKLKNTSESRKFVLISFLLLNFSTDLFFNHSVSWLFYLILFHFENKDNKTYKV
jgi:hypothetical protein